jgi:hypothetical protein
MEVDVQLVEGVGDLENEDVGESVVLLVSGCQKEGNVG